jgi:hypothetical protein
MSYWGQPAVRNPSLWPLWEEEEERGVLQMRSVKPPIHRAPTERAEKPQLNTRRACSSMLGPNCGPCTDIGPHGAVQSMRTHGTQQSFLYLLLVECPCVATAYKVFYLVSECQTWFIINYFVKNEHQIWFLINSYFLVSVMFLPYFAFALSANLAIWPQQNHIQWFSLFYHELVETNAAFAYCGHKGVFATCLFLLYSFLKLQAPTGIHFSWYNLHFNIGHSNFV